MGQCVGRICNSNSTNGDQSSDEDQESSGARNLLKEIGYNEMLTLEKAKNPLAFDYDMLGECIGMGPCGSVHKGTAENPDQYVAVMILIFEISLRDLKKAGHALSQVEHPNIVRLLGYCNDLGNLRRVVYEFVPAKTLAFHLHGYSFTDNDFDPTIKRQDLDWETRMRIARGVAKGLEHLHDTFRPSVFCGSLTSSEIILEEDLNPKLTWFGLGKFGSSEPAREYTRETDVYCFGKVLLELLTGRSDFYGSETDGLDLVDWVKQKLETLPRDALKDSRLSDGFQVTPPLPYEEAFELAMECTSDDPTLRPEISRVVSVMEHLTGRVGAARAFGLFAGGQSELGQFGPSAASAKGKEIG